MKRVYLLLGLIFSFLFSFAQFGEIKIKKLEDLKQQTLNVILDGDSKFNASLKKAIIANWKLSKYVFVKEKTKKDASFLNYYNAKTSSTLGFGPEVPVIAVSNKKGKIYAYLYYPLDGFSSKYLEGYLSLNIKLLNTYLELWDDKSNKISSFDDYLSYIKKNNHRKVKNKKILICKEEFYASENDITSQYKFDYELVSRDVIHDALLKEKDVLIYYPVETIAYTTHTLVSAKDAQVYYSLVGGSTSKSFKSYQKKMFKTLAR